MNSKLHIQFANDMPGATVEVVTPDLETVNRVWLGPDSSQEVEVPSKGAFLRVHLPTGQIVTLHDPGNVNRQIRLADVLQQTERRPLADRSSASPKATKRLRDVRTSHQSRIQADMGAGDASLLRETKGVSETGQTSEDNTKDQQGSLNTAQMSRGETVSPEESLQKRETISPRLSDDTSVHLTSASGHPVPGRTTPDGEEVHFSPVHSEDIYELNVTGSGGCLRVQLPGILKAVHIRADDVSADMRVVSIRVATKSEAADGLMAYLTRGDLYSAASLTSWAESAEQMLHDKMSDPFAAMVGAYLLLRLRRFDLMRSWARNLANFWPHLADGNVIWAWQLIHQREANKEAEIRQYLEKAATGRLPVFAEGLNLLRDGLRLLGPQTNADWERLNQQVGILLCDSPFTAGLHNRPTTTGSRMQFSVGYLARV